VSVYSQFSARDCTALQGGPGWALGLLFREWQGLRVRHSSKGDGAVVKVDYAMAKPVHVVFDSCTTKAHW
jgi:hypothetical protein